MSATLNASQTREDVKGRSTCGTPSGVSASATAFAIAAGAPIEPASPTPFAPSGLSGEGVSRSSLAIGGTENAVGPEAERSEQVHHCVLRHRARRPVRGHEVEHLSAVLGREHES